jgi:hypothetical protein
MTRQYNTKLIADAQMQLLAAGGDKKLSDESVNDNGKPVCLSGCDLRVHIDHLVSCEKQKAKLGITLSGGKTAQPRSHYDDTDDYEISGSINNNIGVSVDKILASILFSCGKYSNFELSLGLNQNIFQDNCGKYEGGWFKTGNQYYGNGFEGFVNPFIWNKRTKGVKIAYVAKGLECFSHYGNKQDHAAVDNQPGINSNSPTQGIFDSDTPAICELGAKYKVTGDCLADLWFAYQQVNSGNESYEIGNYASSNNNEDTGTITQAAEEALQQSIEKSQYINSLVVGFNSNYQGIDLSASLACANTKNISDNEARVINGLLDVQANANHLNVSQHISMLVPNLSVLILVHQLT